MAGDPFWDHVVLRCPFDLGQEGGQLRDFSSSNHPLTAVGANVSVPGKFAEGRGRVGGASSARISVPPSSDFLFGIGDFTIELWSKAVAGGTNGVLSYGVSGQASWRLQRSASQIIFYWSTVNSGTEYFVGSPLPTSGAFSHIAVARHGGTFRLFVNGVMVSKESRPEAGVVFSPASPVELTIGGVWAGNSVDGSAVDDLRITNGVARYTSDANFEVPTEAYPTSGDAPAPEISPPPGLLRFEGSNPVVESGVNIAPTTGAQAFFGGLPTLVEFSGVTPAIGALEFAGVSPVLAFDVELASITGALAIVGRAPGVLVGVAVATEAGQLVVEGGTPGLFTISGTIASQAAMLGLGEPPAPPAHASQAVAMALAEPPPPPTRSSQAALLALGEIVPVVAASQAAILALGQGSSCVSYRCQLWTIRRRDGVVFRYTSHDQPVHRGPFIYSPCRSLDPTASENSSTLGSVGNIELTGIIDDDGISEADLYGGLFDDAFVTVDLYSWGDQAEAPRRLAAGWTGTVSQGSTAFQMEVLGPGSRLDQQALVQMVTPACRWVFGDSRCTVKVEAMRLSGTVVAARTRGHLFVSVPAPPAGRQWASGRIRFVTGPNAGQIVETKSVDFGLGEVVTWVSPGFLAQPGDEIELLPGCDLSRDGGCTLYANVINFGGFPDVPGSDALLETPYAKY